jgi:hypothetical protein
LQGCPEQDGYAVLMLSLEVEQVEEEEDKRVSIGKRSFG